mgnify:CR=1 FL=1
MEELESFNEVSMACYDFMLQWIRLWNFFFFRPIYYIKDSLKFIILLGQWPLLLGDTDIYSQPLLYDINEDGIDEIIITTSRGEIIFVDLFGYPLIGQAFRVPKLRVRKDWYTGLDIDDVDAFYSLKDHQDSDAEEDDEDENSKTIEDVNDEGFNDWLEQERVSLFLLW